MVVLKQRSPFHRPHHRGRSPDGSSRAGGARGSWVARRLSPALCALGVATSAHAHVSLQPASATAGAYQVLRFGLGHGCDGKATTGLRIVIPPEVKVARPQPKPGWRLSIQRPPGDAETVSAIVWKGELPADQFDEFVLLVKLPAGEGRLAFPTLQTCGAADVFWSDPPGSKTPAPTLILTPAAPLPEGGHDHHH